MRGKNFLIVALVIIMLMILPYIFLYFGWTSQKKYEEVEEKEIVINDMDGDGLTDEEEKKLGTNPQQVDSDRDLLKDGEEVAYWDKRMSEAKEYGPNGDIDKDGKKNILDFDSDNDGLSDGYEVKNAYDPANPNEPIKKGKTHDYSISKYNITNFDNFYMNETNEILFYIQPISAPRYWKLTNYARYDDRTWYEEGEQKNRYYEEKIKFDEVQLPSISQTYTVKINGTWLRHIPTSAYTYKVFNFEPKNATIMYSTKTKDDFFAITPVSSYKFSAHLFKYNYSEIANAVVPLGMYEYIALPSLSPRISELAKNITKNYSMPYEKIQAISRYLASNYRYNINRIIPASYDPIDWFLFVGKEGICTEFATAFVILCRANNIPSRFVTGFKPGIVIDDMRVVYKGHAHSWIEVLFNKFGWVGFDVVSNSVGNGTGFGNYGSDNNIIVSYPNATKIGSSGGTGGYNIGYGDTDGDGIQNEIDDDDDNDCLLDIDEINYTTSPYEKDSDFDGIDDFYEINNSSTSPINPDTDGDGLSDYYEIYISHTDPNKFDTDDGGATDWYEVNYNTSSFDSSDDYLLGDSDGDGIIDKEEALYGTDQNKFDTDGDGINDYDELKLGTNPNKADSDGDGINDYDELKLDTDPSKPDSDGDGINDY
ncbi:MAG: transglutaminase domain-containing protein, partial [Candidatus Thermoplasmatota archaeon]